jgi:hypothetical protein
MNTMVADDLVRHLITDLNVGALVETEWLCDVTDANASVIRMHNSYGESHGKIVEEKFRSVSGQPRRLQDLLRGDYRYLSRGRTSLDDQAARFAFLEIAGPHPNAFIFRAEQFDLPVHVICFRSPLLFFLHSAFSKIFILTNLNRHADCLPEHDSVMDGEEYSDTSLLAGLFNDIELLFDLRYLSLSISPPHLADPFEYCERVEGARRFILGHEIGHAVYASHFAQECAHISESMLPNNDLNLCEFLAGRILWDKDTLNLLRTNSDESSDWKEGLVKLTLLLKSDESLSSGWAEEFWCDWFSLNSILQVYGDAELEGPALFELENALIGIITFFTVMDIVDVVLMNHKVIGPTHPPALLRREAMRKTVKQHPIYQRNPTLHSTLGRNWQVLNAFREFAGGANAPPVHSDLWDTFAFRDKLTNFGLDAYRSLFDATVWESLIKYGFDIRKQNADQGSF